MNAWEIPLDLYDHDVRAILAGGKTQIRQIMQFQPDNDFKTIKEYLISRFNGGFERAYRWIYYREPETIETQYKQPISGGLLFTSPFGDKGQTLYVREAWAYSDSDALVTHRATLHPDKLAASGVIWQPSFTMPRIGCRLELSIERIFIERLKDITDKDANAEGAPYWAALNDHTEGGPYTSPHKAFKAKWCEEYGAESWDENPFVFACEFKRIM